MLPRLNTLSLLLAEAAKSVPVGLMYPLFLGTGRPGTPKFPVECRTFSVGARLRAGFLAVARKLAEEWRLATEPDESLPMDALVECEPYEAVEATETERGEMSS